jgi:hypothetical protein
MKPSETASKLKNIKISPRHHEMLKAYCEKNGLKMFHFVEKLIEKQCKPKQDIYGDEEIDFS